MKKILYSLSFLFILSISLIAQPPVKVYVFSGQSNMGVTATLPQEIIDWRDNPANDVLYLPFGETDFVALTGARHEVVFAYYVDQYWKSIDPTQQIAIVRYNVPGTGMAYWSIPGRQNRNQWSPGYMTQGGGNAGLMPLIELGKTLIEGDGKTWEGAGFVWYQGENDCLLISTASTYLQKITDLANGYDAIHDADLPLWGDHIDSTHINGIKDLLNNPDMPVLLARVSNQFTGWGAGSNDWTVSREVVREQHMLFAEKNQPAAWINVDDVPCNDGWHYDGSATWRFTTRFSEEYLKLVNLPVIKPKDGDFMLYRNDKFMSNMDVTITSAFANAEIRYTTDGSDPNVSSTLYTAPFTITETSTIKAIAYYPDQSDSEIATRTYTKLTPLPAQTTGTLGAGVRYYAYSYRTDQGPSFPGFEAADNALLNSEGVMDKFDVNILSTYGNRTILGTGFINITQAGLYSFEIITVEDARLYIDDELVINHVDIPGSPELSGEVALEAGYHRIRVEYLHYAGSAMFMLRYSGGDISPAVTVQPSVLFHELDGASSADIVLSTSAITLASANGSSDVFNIVSSIDPLTIVSDQTWLDVSATSGDYHEKITISANSENNTGSDRTATITVSGGVAVSKTITVTQLTTGAAFTVSEDSITIAYNENSTSTFDITTTQAWSISMQNDNWFTFSQNSGTGNATITVTASENEETSLRDAKFTVTATDGSFQNIIITQESAELYLSAVQFEITLRPNGGNDAHGYIDIIGNAPWTASTDVTWLTLNTNSGTGLGRVFLETSQNTNSTERVAYVVISSPGLPSQKIKVTQLGTDPSLTVSTNTVNLKESTAGVVYVTTNLTWTASTADSWLFVTMYQDVRLGIYAVDENSTGSTRTGTVTISATGVPDEIITVNQLVDGSIFYTETDRVTLDYKINSIGSVKVVSDMTYSVVASDTWFAASMETIAGQQLITVESTEANATGADRTGTCTVSATGMPDVIIDVTQLVSPEVTALPSSVSIGSETGNSNTFSITSNTNWNIASDQTWLDLSSVSGSLDETITVTANAKNYSTSTRAATLTITAVDVSPVTVTITQDGSSTYLTSTETEVTVASTSGSTGTFDIISDIAWTAVSSQTWLDVSSASGAGDAGITLTANADNVSAMPRYASVTLSGAGVDDVVILVIQEGTSNVIAYDYFDADLSGGDIALNGQTTGDGWSTGYIVQNGRTDIPGYNITNATPLTYSNLRSSDNYATGGIQWVGCGRPLEVATTFAAYEAPNGEIGLDGTTLWFSCLAREDDTDNRWELFMKQGGAAWNGTHIVEIGRMAGGNWGLDLEGTEAESAIPVVQSEVALLVIKMAFGTTSTVVDLYVNPVSLGGTEPGSSDAQLTSSAALTFNGIGMYFGSDPGSGSVDELRFGASFADVTPISGAAATYTVTFNVDDGSNPIVGASVDFDGQTLTTDGSGQAVFSNVDIGVAQAYTITNAGFNNATGNVNVIDQDVTENVAMTAFAGYDVTFTVTDGSNPIQDASIDFNSQTLLTDASGQATFSGVLVGNNQIYSVTKTGYNGSSSSVDVVDANVNTNVVITEITYTLTVNSGTGDGTYSDASVVNIDADAPSVGQVFSVWTGDVTNVDDVNAASTTITISGADATVTATYTDLTYTITFNVDTNGTALQDAEVSFNSQTINTDASGVAVFNNVVYGTGLVYSIVKSGFNTESGTIDATSDLTENVAMTLVPVGTYTVTFTVDDGTSPIAGANVAFNSQNVTTNVSGQAIFAGVANGTGLVYTVTMTGYDSESGNVDVSGSDIGETVTLSLTVVNYTLTVTNGTGSGDYAEAASVPITADAPAVGEEFVAWTGDTQYLNDANSSSTTVTMPATDISVTATYQTIVVPTYTLTVSGGTGSGDYAVGVSVMIIANAPGVAEEFVAWTGDNQYLDDTTNDTAYVTMPAMDITVTSTYNDILGIDNDAFSNIRIYPNPAQSYVVIDNISNISMLEIINVTGEIIKSGNITNSKLFIDISGLSSGLYLMKFTDDDSNVETKTLIVD